jgi:hypothetical protein
MTEIEKTIESIAGISEKIVELTERNIDTFREIAELLQTLKDLNTIGNDGTGRTVWQIKRDAEEMSPMNHHKMIPAQDPMIRRAEQTGEVD